MKAKAVICVFISLLVFESGCRNPGIHPFVGITFSGTVTEDVSGVVTPKKDYSFTSFDGVTSTYTGSTTKSGADGSYYIEISNGPDILVGTICKPPVTVPASTDAPIIFLYLDQSPVPTAIKEDFKFVAHTITTGHKFSINIPSGIYTISLKDNSTSNPTSFSPFTTTSVSHIASYPLDRTHKNYTLTVSKAGAISKSFTFMLPDMSTGAIINTTITPF